MYPIQINVQFDAADADGICASQTPTAAAGFSINGALATSGVATLCAAGLARQIVFTAAANETTTPKTATVRGTNATGNAITDTVTMPNATTATTNKYFRTVTSISITANAAGAITVGTNSVGASRVIGLDQYVNPFNVGLGCTVSGTVNYTVQHTFDDVQSTTEPTWFDHTSLAGDTANGDGNYAYAVRAIRLKMNSGTGTVTFTVLQSAQKAA